MIIDHNHENKDTKNQNNNEISYLEKRFEPFGGLQKFEKFSVTDYNSKQIQERTLLSSDEFDNLNIHYYDLYGSPWTFRSKGSRMAKPYIRKRLKNPLGKAKYISPNGSGLLPFFPPELIVKFLNKTKIKKLVLVEGEIKSIIASKFGLDCIGLGSIHGFYADNDGDRPYYKALAPEIIKVINVCQVEELLYLTDADTIIIKYEPDVDLVKRPNSFCSAVINFRNATKRLIHDELSTLQGFYFTHIKDVYDPKSKGLDDLFENYLDKTDEILRELLSTELAGKYFHSQNLAQTQETHLRKYFGLIDHENFYEKYSAYILDSEFVFRNRIYYFDSEKVKMLKNLELDNYVRIGDTYFKIFDKPVFREGAKITVREIKQWKKGEIVTDFGKYAPGMINKYDDFINEPNWTNHKPVYSKCYNICRPLNFTPRPGKFSSTLKFLEHITQRQGFIEFIDGEYKENPEVGNRGTMMLDYLTIMLQHPKMDLPIPCLLSEEQETGKTTFIQWLTHIFEGNSVILGTKDFSGDFNAHYAGKYFIAIDEGEFQDKKQAKASIKKISTDDRVILNTKGVSQREVVNYAKLAICSNDDRDFLHLSRSDNRFWIFFVKSIERKDPEFKERLFNEIPEFVYYLFTRQIFHEKKTRTWFDHRLIMDENFKRLTQSSKEQWKVDIDEVFNEIFEQKEIDEYVFTPINILNSLKNLKRNCNTQINQIRSYLKREYKIAPSDKSEYIRMSFELNFDLDVVSKEGKSGRPYKLTRKQWLESIGESIEKIELSESPLAE